MIEHFQADYIELKPGYAEWEGLVAHDDPDSTGMCFLVYSSINGAVDEFETIISKEDAVLLARKIFAHYGITPRVTVSYTVDMEG